MKMKNAGLLLLAVFGMLFLRLLRSHRKRQAKVLSL